MRRVNRLSILLILLVFAFQLGLLTACRQEENSQLVGAEPSNPIAVTSSPDALTTAIVPSQTDNRPGPTNTVQVQTETIFDHLKAFQYLEEQVAFGPRWPGSTGNKAAGDSIIKHLLEASWIVEEQLFDYQNIQGRNIIGRTNLGKGEVVILGAHYDTRKIADQTPGSNQPVLGAVDGASGVAVLLELARSLDLERISNEVWLSFFDIEDNGRNGMPGFDWIVGSTYMASNLSVSPEAVIVVDMVGDRDQQFYYEGYSDPNLRNELWQLAAELDFGAFFIPRIDQYIIDDHLPFARLGIPAVDIIDFDYPHWHTIEDTIDKASADSLYHVGRLLEVWLEEKDGG